MQYFFVLFYKVYQFNKDLRSLLSYATSDRRFLLISEYLNKPFVENEIKHNQLNYFCQKKSNNFHKIFSLLQDIFQTRKSIEQNEL